MTALVQICGGIDVAPLVALLDAQPALWDAHPERRVAPGSPHAGMTDIWVRYRAREELTCPQAYNEPHRPVWYPAWKALEPGLRPIVATVVDIERPAELGGILITRIPPGGRIGWHDDRGGWHAEYYDRKVYVPLRANDRCVNYCADERVVMLPGTCWHFNNLLPHAVENGGDTERITLIICMRRGA